MDNEMGAPERKADVNETFNEFMGAFEVFKETNDRRLQELEGKSSSDVVTTDKLARVEAALDANQRRMDELVLKSSRPNLSGLAPAISSEKKSAFDGYMRGGDESGLRLLERKGIERNTDFAAGDPGFTVPGEVETEIMRRVTAISPIRSIASVRQMSSALYRKPVSERATAARWVGEAVSRDETATTLTELRFEAMELYAMPAATSTLLDDSAVNIEEWLAEEIQTAFAEQETKAFVLGSGNGEPTGFANTSTIDEDRWEWGSLGRIRSGVEGAFPETNPSDKLLDLVYALKAGYRQNANFVMNRRTQAVIRKMKDADGNYLWTPPAIPGARAGLLGFPVVEAEDMPEMGTDTKNAIAFGDFHRGYLIVDRQGLRILRDPYSAKPYVLFYTTKRVGGGVQDFDAIKILKFIND